MNLKTESIAEALVHSWSLCPAETHLYREKKFNERLTELRLFLPLEILAAW